MLKLPVFMDLVSGGAKFEPKEYESRNPALHHSAILPCQETIRQLVRVEIVQSPTQHLLGAHDAKCC